MRDGEPAQLDDALDTPSSSWLLRRYPWAGSLSTAHTVLGYDRHGRDVFRRLASVVRGGADRGQRQGRAGALLDLDDAAQALSPAKPRPGSIWSASRARSRARPTAPSPRTSRRCPRRAGATACAPARVPVAVRAGARAAAVPRTRPTPSADAVDRRARQRSLGIVEAPGVEPSPACCMTIKGHADLPDKNAG